MTITKNKGMLILTEKSTKIEEYSLSSEINFEGLMNYLLKQNMEKTIEFTYDKQEFDENEINLINIIQELINEYNSKVKDLEEYKNNKKN